MKLERMKFRDDGKDGAIPDQITVTISLAEAYAIAKVFGGFSDTECEKRGLPPTDIYAPLTGDVFNRYWEDGVDGAKQDAFGSRPLCG